MRNLHLQIASTVLMSAFVLFVLQSKGTAQVSVNFQPEITTTPTVDVGSAADLYCGSEVIGNTTQAPSNVSTYSCRPDWVENGPEIAYAFRFLETQPVTISLNALQENVDLDVFLLTSANPASCIAAGNNTIALTTLSGGQDYILVVDGYEGSKGAYRLKTQCALGPQATATSTPTRTPTATPTSTPTATRGPVYAPLAARAMRPTPTPPLQTLVLQAGSNGFVDMQDTTLDSWLPTSAQGTADKLKARWNRDAETDEKTPILRFGLGKLPGNAHVVSAALELYAVERSLPTDVQLAVYGLQRSWSEAGATWERASATQNWAVAGANGIDTDRDSGPITTNLVTETNRWYSFEISQLLRRWQANPAVNYGVTIEARSGKENANVEFTLASAQFPVAGQRPRLVIRYWTPGS